MKVMATIVAAPGFSRGDPKPFCVWFPPRSPVRIEYSRDLCHLLGRGDESAGVLYGERSSRGVRVIASRPFSGLLPMGVFAVRSRGEVFLSENDLARLEGLGLRYAIALVVAGDTGGFFVREPGEAMQTIRSYQEFPVPARRPRRANMVARWAPLAIALMIAVTFFARPAQPARPLEIQSEGGDLYIRLHRSDATDGARLQIVDGEERRSIPITPALSNVVYSPITRDVRVSVTR
jgi:hypothetical protein